MGVGDAEEGEEPVAETFVDRPVETVDDLAAGVLIFEKQLPERLLTDLFGDGGRCHQVTHEHSGPAEGVPGGGRGDRRLADHDDCAPGLM